MLFAESPRLWSQMSNLERRQRIDELKERLFLEIKNKGGGGGGAGYGAPDIPSYNAPAPQQPPSYSGSRPATNNVINTVTQPQVDISTSYHYHLTNIIAIF